MPDTQGDPDQPDLSDVPYEIRKWLLDYQLLEAQKVRVRGELLDMLSGVKTDIPQVACRPMSKLPESAL